LQLPFCLCGQGVVVPEEAAQVTAGGGVPPKLHENVATLFWVLPLEKATVP